MTNSLPQDVRIRSSQEFAHVYAQRRRVGDRYLLVFGALNSSGTTRFGLSVSRKHGGAVQRNRLKRLLREAFRLSRHDLPAGLDLILIPRQNMDAKLSDFRRSLKRLADKLNRDVRKHGLAEPQAHDTGAP